MTTHVNLNGVHELAITSTVNSVVVSAGVVTIDLAGGGSGSVTTFSAGTLSPLFTTSVANPTTTPALSFTLDTQSANLVFAGPNTGMAAAPTFRSLGTADIPDLSGTYQLFSAKDQINGYAGLDGSTLLKTAEFPALIGDVTSTAGGVTTKVVAIQNVAVDPTGPTDTQVLSYSASGSHWTPTSLSALGGANASQLRGINLAASTATPYPFTLLYYNKTNNDWELHTEAEKIHSWMAIGVTALTTVGQFHGCIPSVVLTNAAAANVAVNATEPQGISYTTTNTLGTNKAIFRLNFGTASIFSLGTLRVASFKLKLNQTTASFRIWVGLSDAPGFSASDTPAANMAAFRYSTGTDTFWTGYCATDATHFSVSTSGSVSPNTSIHEFQISYDGTNVNFYIDGTLAGSVSSNLPATSTPMDAFIYFDNNGVANSKAVTLYSISVTDI